MSTNLLVWKQPIPWLIYQNFDCTSCCKHIWELSKGICVVVLFLCHVSRQAFPLISYLYCEVLLQVVKAPQAPQCLIVPLRFVKALSMSQRCPYALQMENFHLRYYLQYLRAVICSRSNIINSCKERFIWLDSCTWCVSQKHFDRRPCICDATKDDYLLLKARVQRLSLFTSIQTLCIIS